MIRLILLCSAPTAATRRAVFPTDEPLDERGLRDAADLRTKLRPPDIALSGPALRARKTAEALQLDARINEALRDLDCGNWAGATPSDIQRSDPNGLAAWLNDPGARPHGGESIAEVIARTRQLLQRLAGEGGRITAVTHSTVIRAAIMITLDAPFTAFWRIDVAPLARVTLHADAERWRLRAMEN